MRHSAIIPFSLATTGGANIPKGATAVQDFSLEQYLGTWYEIARIDFSFEKGLDHTTANYSLNPNGTVKVLNRGYDVAKGKWKEAEGTAKFRGDTHVGELKVSFFGPFYSGYNVIGLEEYQYALVAGANTHLLWILSRTTTLPDAVKERFLTIARQAGYDTHDLIWVNQK